MHWDVLGQRGSSEGPDPLEVGVQSHLEEKGAGKPFLPSSPSGKTLLLLSLLGGLSRFRSPCAELKALVWCGVRAWWLCWSVVSSPLAVMDGLPSYCLHRAHLWEPLSIRTHLCGQSGVGFCRA